jgi:hypothetical protein
LKSEEGGRMERRRRRSKSTKAEYPEERLSGGKSPRIDSRVEYSRVVKASRQKIPGGNIPGWDCSRGEILPKKNNISKFSPPLNLPSRIEGLDVIAIKEDGPFRGIIKSFDEVDDR